MNGPYQFINQTAVTNAMASGQNIDWASLAQQWIKMRDSAPSAGVEANDFSIATARYEEEKGEADMDMDDEEHLEKDPQCRTVGDTIMQQGTIADPSSSQWYADKTNATESVGIDYGVISQNQWGKWNNPLTPRNATSRRPINPSVQVPSLLKINVPHTNEVRAIPDVPSDSASTSNVMEAAKRKGLPAWIREGLEKMEREKQKQQGKHQTTETEQVLSGAVALAKPATLRELETDFVVRKQSEGEYDGQDDRALDGNILEKGPHKESSKESADVIEVSAESYEQKLERMMVLVRHTLTELLLEVTNEEISKLANETLKSSKLKASSALVVHNSALSTITGKLGLAVYGHSSSEDSSDDDDNASDSKRTLTSDDNDSEEDIKASLRQKKRAFQKVANEIEDRVSAAAAREAEKLKQYTTRTIEAEEIPKKIDKNVVLEKNEMVTCESVAGSSSKSIGNIIDESGEATETKLQNINGKRHRDRGALKERTSRFSDNRDNKYLTMSATVTCVSEAQSKPSICNSATSYATVNQNLALYNINTSVSKQTCLSSVANNVNTTVLEGSCRQSRAASQDQESDQSEKYAKRKYKYSDKKCSRSVSRSRSRSSSRSSTSSSSSSEASTTTSSDDSKNSRHSHSRYSTSKKRRYRHNHREKSYYSLYEKNRKSSSRRRHESDSNDEDEYSNRRKTSSRNYSSSHSRSHNSSRSDRDSSRSRSKSYYSSSRRH
ncbi:arginine/serine-rich protein PNISR-like [Musca vetustissima]|uniref:arginine/serine-rich protein PNISR-like n=1 Tax=Musca vetustissima TaxID=27455 RepID=UPI002AB7EC8D|nr:arginine/serine-rich protein PNISR-like [Musca vetustissima]